MTKTNSRPTWRTISAITGIALAAVAAPALLIKGCKKEAVAMPAPVSIANEVGSTNYTNASASRIVTTPEKDTSAPAAYNTDWNMKGTKLGEVSSAKVNYTLDNVVLNGSRYITAFNEAPFAATNEVHARLFDPAQTTLVYNRENKALTPKSSGFYVPQAAFTTNKTLAHRIGFTFTNAPEQRTDFSLGTDGVDVGTVKTTAADIPFNFPTIKLNENEFYQVDLGTNYSAPGRLTTLLVPVKGTLVEVHPQPNNYTFDSSSGLYFLNWVATGDYRARTNQPPKTVIVKTNQPPAVLSPPRASKIE